MSSSTASNRSARRRAERERARAGQAVPGPRGRVTPFPGRVAVAPAPGGPDAPAGEDAPAGPRERPGAVLEERPVRPELRAVIESGAAAIESLRAEFARAAQLLSLANEGLVAVIARGEPDVDLRPGSGWELDATDWMFRRRETAPAPAPAPADAPGEEVADDAPSEHAATGSPAEPAEA